MSSNEGLKSKLLPIIKADSIKTLIGTFEMILNTNQDLDEFYLRKTRDFINNINGIRSLFTEKEKKDYDSKFDKDPYLVGLLKKNIQNLYSTKKRAVNRFRSSDYEGKK